MNENEKIELLSKTLAIVKNNTKAAYNGDGKENAQKEEKLVSKLFQDYIGRKITTEELTQLTG